jgi:hypothetical protein
MEVWDSSPSASTGGSGGGGGGGRTGLFLGSVELRGPELASFFSTKSLKRIVFPLMKSKNDPNKIRSGLDLRSRTYDPID